MHRKAAGTTRHSVIDPERSCQVSTTANMSKRSWIIVRLNVAALLPTERALTQPTISCSLHNPARLGREESSCSRCELSHFHFPPHLTPG